MTSLHFVMIGDVGGMADYHVGDEAMLEANLSQFRRLFPNPTFTVISRDPAWTSRRYGVESMPPLGFPNARGQEKEREAFLVEMIRQAEAWAAQGRPNLAGLEAIIVRLANSNGLIISGGGNMQSAWPGYLYERIALIRLAALFQKPTIILGQTIGPDLTPTERERLAEALPLAQLVGVREQSSANLVRALGVAADKIVYQLDDAFFLEASPPSNPRCLSDLNALPRPWIAITLHAFTHPSHDSELAPLAQQLDQIAEATQAHLVFIPHYTPAPDQAALSDVNMGRQIAAHLKPTTHHTVLDLWTPREVCWLTSQAALVISSRYHPLVFALSKGVPGLGIYVDDYTRVKLQGALAHAELQAWTMPLHPAQAGLLAKGALDLWQARAEVKDSLSKRKTDWQQLHNQHWTRVCATLGLQMETYHSLRISAEEMIQDPNSGQRTPPVHEQAVTPPLETPPTAAVAPGTPPNSLIEQTHPAAYSSPPLAICTIISKNYLAQARCLAESFLTHHPGSQVFVLLVDHLDGYFDPTQEKFVTVLVEDLNIPNFKSLAFGYNVTELNTAVKPFFLEYLFQQFALHKLCYFDPDILIYESLTDLDSKLEQFGIVLTPHLSGFLNDENTPNELTILVSGAYNLGFIGLARHPELENFLQWWQRKLLKYCVADIRQGLFVDQRWIDLVPSLFASVHILRDPGYNVAYWNLHHRQVQADPGGYTVNGASLKFFHFSGFLPENMETISKYQNRFTFKELGEVKKLFLDYRQQLIAHGYATVQQWPYAYRVFDDGSLISDIFRQIYRAADSEGHRWPNPFSQAGPDTFSQWLNQPTEPNGNSPRLITNLSLEIYRQRSDLQTAFPDIEGRDRLRFANWFVIDAQHQHHLDERFIQPIREAVDLSFASSPVTTPEAVTSEVRPVVKPTVKLIPRLRSLIARRVMQLNASRLGSWAKQRLGQRLTNRLKFHFWNIFNPPPVRTGLPLPPPSPTETRAVPAPGLNLVGYIHSETGVGEAGRNTLRALRSQGYPTAYTNLKYELARQADQSCDDIPEGNPYALNLIHANADQVPGVIKTVGSDFFAGKYNIGFWFWELTSFPERWREHAGVFNEIWVASTFTQATLAPLLPIPVVRMRPCIEVKPVEGIDRQTLGLPENKFVFLFTFDILSICERKNPWAVIEAYRQAFGTNSKEVVLVIKVNNLQRALGLEKALGLELGFETQLAQAIDSVSGILLEAHLDRGVVNALYNSCDCFVSLHRSEGFGLSLAESMYLGKPCIATAYSSNMDFMTPANSYLVDYQLVTLERDYGPYQTGSVWADPDVHSAAGLMRRVFENPEEAAQKGQLAAADIRRFYSADSAGREMIRRLELVTHAPHWSGR